MEDRKVKAGSIAVGMCLFVIAVLLIVLVVVFYRHNNEKAALEARQGELETSVEEKTKEAEEYKNKINQIDEIINGDKKNSDESKYVELTEEINKDLNKDNHFVIIDAQKNDNETYTLKGRIYVDAELPKLTKADYSKLMKDKTITILNREFELGEYDEEVKGYVIEDANGVKIYVTDDQELINPEDTPLVQGTEEFYKITVADDTKLVGKEPFVNSTADAYFGTAVMDENNDLLNLVNSFTFKFKKGSVSEINF